WVEDVRSVIKLDPKLWNNELRKFGKLWPDALNSVQTYQANWAELRANWREYGVERAQMFANGEGQLHLPPTSIRRTLASIPDQRRMGSRPCASALWPRLGYTLENSTIAPAALSKVKIIACR